MVLSVKYANAANSITMVRIIGTICLLFVNPFTVPFFIIYTLSGLSDACDGYVARVTKTSSAFGAALDSFADIILYAMMAIKIFPKLLKVLPVGIWYAVTAIVVLRIVSYLFVAIKYKRFASLHTKLNKITGFAVFMIPYMMVTQFAVPYCITACSISGISTVHEIYVHVTSKEYEGKEKQ
ncbi:MAG: hypothetical protein E7406_04290 [Ruminococcaceae bacterium]|nr:hypothetical protein [Oscillospiraceae bacterium]